MKNTESGQNLSSPGQQLLQAREQQDVSVEMVAQRLRLSVHQIHALEEGNYAQFPAIAYVRGYLRGYANMVKLDPEQLITSFDEEAGIAPPIEPFVSRPKQQAVSGDKHVRVASYSLAAVLALLLGLWWQTQRSSQETPLDQNAEQTASQQTKDDSLTGRLENDNETLSADTLQLPERSGELSSSYEEPKELMHDFGVQKFSELPEPQEQDPQTELPSSIPLSEPITENISQDNDQLSSPISVSTDPVQMDQDIVLQFTDDSWVQITDATDDKRYSGLGKAGKVVHVTGVAPFHIVIGRASVVIMSYQGDFIDLEPLAKDEVARFTLNKDGAHR